MVEDNNTDYSKSLVLAKQFYDRLENSVVSNDLLSKLKIVKCEVIKYHYPNYLKSRFIFTCRLLIRIVVRPSLFFSLNEETTKSEILAISTQKYIYNDSLKPIINGLKTKSVKTTTLSIEKKYSNKIFLTLLRNNAICEFFSTKFNLLKWDDLIPVLYIYILLIDDIKITLSYLKSLNLSNIRVLISADPCDLCSRSIAFAAKEQKIMVLTIQSGLPDFDSCEWEMTIDDLLCCWPEHSNYFELLGRNYREFFPPRFQYIADYTNKEKKYDVFVFLTWIDRTETGKKILESMSRLLIFLSNDKSLNVGVKFHPAMPKLPLKIPKDIDVINIQSAANEIVSHSHKVLCFGSTIICDCLYQGIPVGVVNFANQIPDNSLLLRGSVFNIKNLTHLNEFLESERKPRKKSIIDYDLVEDFIFEKIK